MLIKHPHTNQVIGVPDEQAPGWLNAGWLDATPPVSPDPIDLPTPNPRGRTKSNRKPVGDIKEGNDNAQ